MSNFLYPSYAQVWSQAYNAAIPPKGFSWYGAAREQRNNCKAAADFALEDFKAKSKTGAFEQ